MSETHDQRVEWELAMQRVTMCSAQVQNRLATPPSPRDRPVPHNRGQEAVMVGIACLEVEKRIADVGFPSASESRGWVGTWCRLRS